METDEVSMTPDNAGVKRLHSSVENHESAEVWEVYENHVGKVPDQRLTGYKCQEGDWTLTSGGGECGLVSCQKTVSSDGHFSETAGVSWAGLRVKTCSNAEVWKNCTLGNFEH